MTTDPDKTPKATHVHDFDVPEDEGYVWGSGPPKTLPGETRQASQPARGSATGSTSRLSGLASLRMEMCSAGFGTDRVRAVIAYAERIGYPELRAASRHLVLEQEDDERLALLTQLFHAGQSVPVLQISQLLSGLDVRGLAALGLVRIENDMVRSRVRIREVDGLFVMYDADHTRKDCVMGPMGSSRMSAACTPREFVDTALDVGTGSGVQALLMARHAAHVVATDINPRALRYVELNACLNGLANIETREGDFFEPVSNERFDLVVANPPYVISPDLRFDYRDAREQGDRLSRRVLSELPAFLREGGIATMQGNWIHALAEPWFTRPSSCLDGCGCDSLLLRISLTDPLAYAVFWAQHDHPHDPDGFDRTVRRWRASYVASGIERISTAMVIVRRRLAKTNWQRAVSVLGDVTSALGEALPSLFSLQDRFDDLDGEALLELRLCPTAGARMETQLGTEGNGRAILRCNSALGGQRSISLSVAKCIVRFDGEATLRESLAAAGYVDVDPEHAEALAEFRALLLLGYLQPV